MIVRKTKISLTYCIYIYIYCFCCCYACAILWVCCCYVADMLLLCCCYAAAMPLLCTWYVVLFCCYAVAVLMLCCCTVVAYRYKFFSHFVVAFRGIDFAKIIHGWDLFRETSIFLIRVCLKSISFIRHVGIDIHWSSIFW